MSDNFALIIEKNSTMKFSVKIDGDLFEGGNIFHKKYFGVGAFEGAGFSRTYGAAF